MALVPPDQQPMAEQIFATAAQYPAQPAMPFADAISLARFLQRIRPQDIATSCPADIVGGETEIAGITRYEGFKWVNLKTLLFA